MAALAFLVVLILPMVGHASAAWCVCKPGTNESLLQKTIDYACGAGADCNPIHSNGPCYNPNTVLAHCNYAVNSFFQRKGQATGTCDFVGAASVTGSDPSSSGCSYPASASASNTGTVPVSSTTPSTSTGTTPTNPYSTTNPNTGVLGGMGNGLGPSSYNDENAALQLRAAAGIILAGAAAMLLWV